MGIQQLSCPRKFWLLKTQSLSGAPGTWMAGPSALTLISSSQACLNPCPVQLPGGAQRTGLASSLSEPVRPVSALCEWRHLPLISSLAHCLSLAPPGVLLSPTLSPVRSQQCSAGPAHQGPFPPQPHALYSACLCPLPKAGQLPESPPPHSRTVTGHLCRQVRLPQAFTPALLPKASK